MRITHGWIIPGFSTSVVSREKSQRNPLCSRGGRTSFHAFLKGLDSTVVYPNMSMEPARATRSPPHGGGPTSDGAVGVNSGALVELKSAKFPNNPSSNLLHLITTQRPVRSNTGSGSEHNPSPSGCLTFI